MIPLAAGLLALGLAGCGEKAAGPKASVPAPARAGGDWVPGWPMTRGGGGLTGRVAGPAPRMPSVEWTFANGSPVTSEAAVGEGLIVFGDGDGSINAVETAGRKRRWQVKTGDTVEAAPAIIGGKVFAGSNDGVFRALDARTGEVAWSMEGGEKFPTGAVLTERNGEPVLLVNGYDGIARCLRPADGKEIWRRETGDYVNGSPVLLDGGWTAFGGCDAKLHILRVADGTAGESLKSDAQIIRTMAAWDDTLYGVNYANQLFAAARDGERPVWIYEAEDTQFLTSPAADEKLVYAGCRDKCLHAVDRLTGKPVWKFRTGGRVSGAPLVFDDAVVFGSADGRLYAVAKEDGAEIWKLELGGKIELPPAFAGGRLIVGGGEGTLFVVRGGGTP
ncbi:MAG: PQQ-binding-like beta-propeller repeat protein [Verrucomicrobia bacterium]|nr:PQQ-binding-like beta-propeller repeat protein [Verrucomicrobiota bacterium]